MCDYLAGELLLSHHRDDPAAKLLLEQIDTHEIPHVTILERLRPASRSSACHRGQTPRSGSSGWESGQRRDLQIGYLEFFYKHAVLRAMDERRFDFSQKVHQQILGIRSCTPRSPERPALRRRRDRVGDSGHGLHLQRDQRHAQAAGRLAWRGEPRHRRSHPPARYRRRRRRRLQRRRRTELHRRHPNAGRHRRSRPRTALASILHDVAPDAEIVVYKIADASGLASEWSLLGGLAAASGAQVVNVSSAFGLGALACGTCGRASHSTRSGLFEAALAELVAAPDAPIIVAAAGNASQTTLAFPARYRDVLAVASVDAAGSLSGFTDRSTVGHDGQAHRTCSSSRAAPDPTVAAPTEYIGTSEPDTPLRHPVAAAYASAMIARMWSEPARRHWTRNQISRT